jgi:hypothetical protein
MRLIRKSEHEFELIFYNFFQVFSCFLQIFAPLTQTFDSKFYLSND